MFFSFGGVEGFITKQSIIGTTPLKFGYCQNKLYILMDAGNILLFSHFVSGETEVQWGTMTGSKHTTKEILAV